MNDLFEAFREDLDDHNDRRERIIKVCAFLCPMRASRTEISP